ncbi:MULTISPECIES: Hint domain-containing protein [Methylorubrum]|uniref:Hint domain-containing protein n=1 Tax=Methylorubrum TaxID=2282523 RepID=UPI00209CD9D3|nr:MULTISPECIES: Hint domain-containing protein [Methylorubrum]MCP1551653.1 hypothetical protein [Methylorubrum zatmanii]MCP1556581.1 hypothetical protein [Methylorubrum extorquens]MCP1581988.1 hypothetical protein [Methylorubrum extorquens]
MAYYAGLNFVDPYQGAVTFTVDTTVYPRQITNITGTINGNPVTGPTTYAGANNLLAGFGERVNVGVQRERGYLFDGGVSFSAGGVDYNVRNPSNSFFGQNVISSSAAPGVTNPVELTAIADPNPVCFVSGTLIETTRGAVAVEDLAPGDVAVTASGGRRPIVWIGHRTVEAQPVRISAGAFGGGLPLRDLYLSPGHPVLVGADADNEGGCLVPIMCLENGTSIARTISAPVTYWHVELDAHDVILAEGLPAESYIDGGDRAFFAEASDHALHNPDFVPPGWGARCRPVAIDGPAVDAERRRLSAVFAASLERHSAWPAGELVL